MKGSYGVSYPGDFLLPPQDMTEAGGSSSGGRGEGTPCPASSCSASDGISAPKQRDGYESELERVRREIAELGPKISRLEEKLEAAEAVNDEKKLERLSSELKQLREEKNLLHQEKLKLMDQRGAAEGQWHRCEIAQTL